MSDEQFTVLTDSPGVDRGDWLGRLPSAEQIADLIIRSKPNSPFTIGIDGTWGAGKSTFMLMIRTKLKSLDIPTVWFNAWMHQHKENPAEGLVKSILLVLHGRLRLYWLFARRVGITLLKIVLHAALGQLKISDSVVDEIWTNFNQDIALANDFRDRLGKAISKRTKRKGLITVFIDDLDRCDPDAVIKLFEAVKVYLDVKGLVFVLGYDRQALVDAVQNRLISEHAELAARYLEKIVQIPYPLPTPTEDQIQYCLSHYLEESRTATVFTTDIRPLIISNTGKNPRRMKRFVNSFALAHTLGFFPGDLDFQARMWLVWLHYRSLSTVFMDDLKELGSFVYYAIVREALNRGNADAMEKDTSNMLHNLLPVVRHPENREDVIKQLDDSVSPSFTQYYRNEAVLSLVRSLADAYEQRDVGSREALQEATKKQAETLESSKQLFES